MYLKYATCRMQVIDILKYVVVCVCVCKYSYVGTYVCKCVESM